MIKKWVLAAIAYLVVVMVAFGIYDATVEKEPMKMDQKEVTQDN
jgi:hypothetical protein